MQPRGNRALGPALEMGGRLGQCGRQCCFVVGRGVQADERPILDHRIVCGICKALQPHNALGRKRRHTVIGDDDQVGGLAQRRQSGAQGADRGIHFGRRAGYLR